MEAAKREAFSSVRRKMADRGAAASSGNSPSDVRRNPPPVLPPTNYRRRSKMRSPTRNAFAMIVNAGFTAPLDGKKAPSTT